MKKPMVSLGAVATLIGGSITIYGQQNYDRCDGMRRALEDIARNSPGYQSWNSQCEDYRIVIIVGAIILVVGIIILLGGLFSPESNETVVGKPATPDPEPKAEAPTRISKLNELRDKGLITEEEYNKKREEILNSL